MCGIAGIVSWRPLPAVLHHQSALDAMAQALAHRGPDGQGIWTSPLPPPPNDDPFAALVHRRLAIIDLPGGHQPMANETGQVQVVFNGEIYNHTALRQELIAAGHRFASDHCDTEVLVHGWEEWGEELPTHLRGMFAFAIYDFRRDDATNTLFLARDRMGQKPLFYALLDDSIVFGSTILSVLAWPTVPRRVPREQIALYLLLGYLPPPHTIYRDISQLQPGHALTLYVRPGGEVTRGHRYWDAPIEPTTSPPPPTTPPLTTAAEITAEIRRQITTAVTSQLSADVPLTCFLSGGLDSSIIATLMQQAVRALSAGGTIQTVSVGFSESRFDETAYAAQVATHIGSRHTRLEVAAGQNVPETLSALMRTGLGQPFADSSIIPTYHLSRAVRALAPVALSGDGGDELFGGYDRYRALPLLQRWSGLLRYLPTAYSRNERLRRLKAAARGRDLPERYTRLTALFSPEEIARLLPDTLVDYAPIRMELHVPPAAAPQRYAMARDQHDYLPGDVLYKVDTAAMAVALEVRSPLLDHDVVTLANSLPTAAHFAPQTGRGKHLFRQAFADQLPPAILDRPKQGFGVPIGAWFRGPLQTYLQDTLMAQHSFTRQHLNIRLVEQLLSQHRREQRDHTHRLFSLLMLELWWQEAHATLA